MPLFENNRQGRNCFSYCMCKEENGKSREVKCCLDLHPPRCQGRLQRQEQLLDPEQGLPVLDPGQCHPTPPETVDNDI